MTDTSSKTPATTPPQPDANEPTQVADSLSRPTPPEISEGEIQTTTTSTESESINSSNEKPAQEVDQRKPKETTSSDSPSMEEQLAQLIDKELYTEGDYWYLRFKKTHLLLLLGLSLILVWLWYFLA